MGIRIKAPGGRPGFLEGFGGFAPQPHPTKNARKGTTVFTVLPSRTPYFSLAIDLGIEKQEKA